MSTTTLHVLTALGWQFHNGAATRLPHVTSCHKLVRSTNSKAIPALSAILDGMVAAGFKIQRRNRNLMRFIDRLSKSLVFRYQTLIPHIKQQCLELRRFAIGEVPFSYEKVSSVVPKVWRNLTPKRAMQLSFIARALPTPGKRVCEVALAKFDSIVHGQESWGPDSDRALGAFDTLLKPLKFNSRFDRANIKFFGTSSCLGSTRKEGGRSGLLGASGLIPKSSQSQRAAATAPAVRLRGPELKFRNSSLVSMALFKVPLELPPVNNMEVVAVKELGYKARIVTKSDPAIVALGHEVRHRLWPVLRRWRQCWDSLGDPPGVIPIAEKPRVQRRFVWSADFSSATDTISHRVYAKFCDKFGINPRLVYEGMSTGGVLWTRGAPMGLPLSWLCLELVHVAIALHVDSDGQFRIRGDDLIAVWTTTQWSLYCRLTTAIGLVVNLKKSFKSTTRGIFCEAAYEYHSGMGLVRKPYTSLRFLQRGADTDWFSIGATCRKFLQLGVPKARLKRLVLPHLSYPLKVYKDLKLDPYLPIEFGGFGLPFKDKQSVRLIDACHIHNVVNGVGTSIPRILGDPGLCVQTVLGYAKEVRYVHERTLKACPHWERAFSSLLRFARECDDLCGHIPKRVSLRTQLKKLGRFRMTEARPLEGLTYTKVYELLAFLKPSALSTVKVVGDHGACSK